MSATEFLRSTRPMSEDIGLDVEGIQIADHVDNEDFLIAVEKALRDNLLLRFRGQHLDGPTTERFAGYFGPLMDIKRAGVDAIHVPGADRIKVISNGVDEKTGRLLGDGNSSAQIWHTDATSWEAPPAYITFYCRRTADPAPKTSFLNMIKVYESLPADLKERIRDLRVMHYQYPRAIEVAINAAGGTLPPEERKKGTLQPLVRRHLPSHKPILYLSYRKDSYIPGLSWEESRALLEELWAITDAAPSKVGAALMPDDLVIWDNRACLHSREGWDQEQTRVMWHLTSEGECPTAMYPRRTANLSGIDPTKQNLAPAMAM
jgi:taurine dioxygenase